MPKPDWVKFNDQRRHSAHWRAIVADFDKKKVTATAIFSGATRVETFRLFPTNSQQTLGKINNFPIYEKGQTQDSAFAQKLGDIVLNAETYQMPGQSLYQCYFEPGVAFRVWKEKQFVDTIICFSCHQLAIVEHNSKVPMNTLGASLKGRFYVAGDFIARPQLLKLTRQAFPNLILRN